MIQPDFWAISHGVASVRPCALWVLKGTPGSPERCGSPAYYVTDKAVTAVDVPYCEEHILSQAVLVEKFRLDGAYD